MTDPPEVNTRATPPTPRAAAAGLFRFSLEGRRAPGLFVAGWLATLVGGGLLLVGVQAGAGLVAAGLWIGGLLLLGVGGLLLAGSQTVERQAAGAAYGGPSPVLVFLLIIVASQLLGFAVGTPLLLLGVQPSRPWGDLLAVMVQAVAFLGVIRLVVVAPGALAWAQMGLRGPAHGAFAGLLGGALFAGPVILVTLVLALVAVGLAGVTPPSPLPPTGTPTGLVLHLVAGAIVAPIYEEVLFRGVALTAWSRTVGPRGAILRSSILFVLAHLLLVSGDDPSAAVATAFVAAVVRIPIALTLGWLYVRTGSLWAPIGLHAAFNGVLIAIGESTGLPGAPASLLVGIAAP